MLSEDDEEYLRVLQYCCVGRMPCHYSSCLLWSLEVSDVTHHLMIQSLIFLTHITNKEILNSWVILVITFQFAGIIILGYGFYKARKEWYFFYILKDSLYHTSCALILISGSLLFITGLVGYVGTVTKSKSLITIVRLFEANYVPCSHL